MTRYSESVLGCGRAEGRYLYLYDTASNGKGHDSESVSRLLWPQVQATYQLRAGHHSSPFAV